MLPHVLRFTIARTCYEQKTDIEDVVQETFAAMCQRWQQLLKDPKMDWNSLRRYVMTIATHKRVDRFRSRTRTRQALEQLGNAHREPIVNIDETIFECELWRWAKTLPSQQRTVFALRFWGDMEGDEIAKTMKIRPSTARNHLVAVRKSYVKHFGTAQPGENRKGE
jgi:RNA polymerase sigma factor (sigma-70 family)